MHLTCANPDMHKVCALTGNLTLDLSASAEFMQQRQLSLWRRLNLIKKMMKQKICRATEKHMKSRLREPMTSRGSGSDTNSAPIQRLSLTPAGDSCRVVFVLISAWCTKLHWITRFLAKLTRLSNLKVSTSCATTTWNLSTSICSENFSFLCIISVGLQCNCSQGCVPAAAGHWQKQSAYG